MLKALELYGFKSFADKTRFEFPDGITVVVGPNGSGKSNVVDAIRWVLGEQSAKSLRGAEMADVIFKGSGQGQRRPSNTAEVTIVFDNSTGLLDMEQTEVRVTRRVYRSGEGEYLINDEPCRLKDIRNLFRGTGVGTDAYSLIEQGKVDNLLQASPGERRAIFEEAAGISRFKAKKVETKRRLDRVEQNLLRLSDIVEEVERRLKSLRNQATKARRYREYTDRLKELRTHVGLTDYRSISVEWDSTQQQLAALATQLSTLNASSHDADQTVATHDARLQEIKSRLREVGGQLTETRAKIAGLETTSDLQRKTLLELESEEDKCRKRLAGVNSRAGDVQMQLEEVRSELDQAETQYKSVQSSASDAEQQLDSVTQKLAAQREAEREERRKHEEQLRATSELTSQLQSLESELSSASSAIARDEARRAELQSQLDAAKQQAAKTESLEAELQRKLRQATDGEDQAQKELEEHREKFDEVSAQLSQCQQQRSAAAERSNVLEEVERRLEGIGAGTKDLLAKAKTSAGGPLSEIRGMVADLVEVKVEMAPLIDAALGERAQYMVVTGQRLIRGIADNSIRLRGRVGLISLSSLDFPKYRLDPQIASEDGVIGHATDFVQVDEPYRDLARHMLGTTWFVRSIEVGLFLREKYRSAPWRFVTSGGEIVEADGTVFGGPRLSSGGIVSRRSELRSLQTQLHQLTQQEQLLEQKLSKVSEAREASEKRLREWLGQRKSAGDEFASIHAKAEAARQLVEQNESNHKTLLSGLSELQDKHAELSLQQTNALDGLSELESLVSTLASALGKHRSSLAEIDQQRQTHEQEVTTAKIDLAKVEQRVETLRVRALQCEQDNEERAKAVAEIQTQVTQSRSRHRDTSRAILEATSRMSELYLELEAHEGQLKELRSEELEISADREAKLTAAKKSREELQSIQQAHHAMQLQAGELRMKRDTVAERVRDDYGIELAEIEDDVEEQGEREEVETEIGDLRRKINNIGAVNMESLAELDELEERFGSLSLQYDDLIKAKETLERIIQRINVDSRKMFSDTLDVIRANFQSLFRRAFGGGHADIVVEEGVDILDAGIDIVATPPGKHSLNISLLSGGERALSAVTLLLAVFRYRPSPFCILDEVDGPLDEANIGRFVDVLKEFLATTKVVIVTHSKKTMSAATTLYGVTMQVSGVSKRVSVQFNDVREDGSIRTDASDDGEAA